MVLEKSPFPDGFLGVHLFYDGAWQPLGEDLDQRTVTVAHGARSEGGTADVSTLSFRVTNSAGKYSPRNPTSPLYGRVGRNTPARAVATLGAPWLDLEASGSRATTPDTAALDITGDLDVRWWGARDSWGLAADVISKWSATGNQRSWLLRAEADQKLTLFWTANGSTTLEARSLVPVPPWLGEVALRVTLDVDNGAGGRTARFYWAPGLAGPWTQLGPDVAATGTTSIFNSTAALTVGREPTSAAFNTPQRVHGWEVRSGIDGTVVSSVTLAGKTVGATSFADDQGRTWTVAGGSVSNTHVLAVAEVAEWPVDWNTKGAPSVMTSVEAAGVTRRLGQGAQAIDSVLYRTISGISGLVGYWPMEDGSDAVRFGAALGSKAAAFSQPNLVTPAAYDSFPGSAPLPTLGGGRIRAEVDPRASTGQVQVRWVQWTPPDALPLADVVVARVELSTGTIGQVDLRLRDSDGALGLFLYDFDGNQLSGSTFFSTPSVKGTSQRFSIELEQDGSAVDARWVRLQPGGTGVVGSLTFAGQTVGRVSQVILNPEYRDLPNMAVGHLTVERAITSIFDVFGGALVGYRGETAGARMARLARENGIVLQLRSDSSAPLGEQQEETLLDLLAESAAADGGLLHDDPHTLGIRYRNLRSLGDQIPVTIPYQDNLIIPFTPSDDDGLTRNRVTVSRPNGSRITHESTSGPMSIQAPPAGVGLYDETLTRNLNTDELVDRTASWRLHVGTWDEARYPSLGVDLAHPFFLGNPELTRRLLDLAPGDRVVITDPPPWLPPRSVDVLVMGVQIEVEALHLRLRWTCVPARPYRVAYWNAGHRFSGAGTATAGFLATVTTSFTVIPPTGVQWTHDDGDYDITIGGEVMTVTNVVGNVFTVTRSVNGVAKTHAAGAAVELANPSFYSR